MSLLLRELLKHFQVGVHKDDVKDMQGPDDDTTPFADRVFDLQINYNTGPTVPHTDDPGPKTDGSGAVICILNVGPRRPSCLASST